MDLSILVTTVISFLAPFFPYLTKAGEKAAEEAGKQMGGAAWKKAKALWGKLWPKMKDKAAAQEAVEGIAHNPVDASAQATLRLQLKKILAEDASLSQEVAEMVKAGAQAGIINIAAGDGSVVLGGDIVGSAVNISTGGQKNS